MSAILFACAVDFHSCTMMRTALKKGRQDFETWAGDCEVFGGCWNACHEDGGRNCDGGRVEVEN